MKKTTFAFGTFSLLLSLILNFFTSSLAEAKVCSARDRYFYADGPRYRPDGSDGSPAFVSTFLFSRLSNSDVDVTDLYKVLAKWKRATKSSALKSAISKMEKELDKQEDFRLRLTPQLQMAYDRIGAIIDNNRC